MFCGGGDGGQKAGRAQRAAAEIGEVAGTSVKLSERRGRLFDQIAPLFNKPPIWCKESPLPASDEQSIGVGEISGAMEQLSRVAQQDAASSEQLAATAEGMSARARQLRQVMVFFRLPGVQAAIARPLPRWYQNHE